MSRVRIHLRGSLRSIHEGPIELEVETAAEAIQALCAQLPGMRPDANGRKRIRIKDHPTEASLHSPLQVTDLHIFPQMNGGKNGGFVQILVAAALIAASFIVAGPAGLAEAASAIAAGGAAATFSAFLAVTLFMTGVSMAVGGLLAILMPAPSMDGQKAVEGSKYLGVPRSTVAIGTTIRLIYGLRRVGFHILAVNVNARNYTP